MTGEDKKRERAERSSGGATAMVLSRRSVTVSGCRRIIEYGSVRVRIATLDGELTVEGRGLTVYTYCGDELVIRGCLNGIYFEK